MAALQVNALDINPNQLQLTEVATYSRRIHASITRVWENVLDWEHLPWLHSSSFNFIELIEAGDWGWRTWSDPKQTSHVELCVDQAGQQYVARSYHQGKQTSEIWTRLSATTNHEGQDETNIQVSFDLVGIKPNDVLKLGEIYLGLYKQLWDEDEVMMAERQTQLDKRYLSSEVEEVQLNLGTQETLKQSLPRLVELDRRSWVLREYAGDIVVHAAVCPHQLGPLSDAEICDNQISCPWHGYKFDINTGQCESPSGAQCSLPPPPTIISEDGIMVLKWV